MIDPKVLLTAYTTGCFPMAEDREGPIRWFSPDPRAIIPLDAFRISRSLRQTLKKNIYDIRYNADFESVIRTCAGREETWISGEIIESYLRLYELGFAHSVEAWHGDTLAGGLYGVTIGGAFFGESMFSTMRDASKVALVHLVNTLKACGFELLDTQMTTPHLEQFGTIAIPRNEYLLLLQKAIRLPRTFSP